VLCCEQVLLSPAVVVYSPRVLPVYVYDAHADSAKNVRQVSILLFLFMLKLEAKFSLEILKSTLS